MEIRTIELEDGLPVRVTAEMSADEAALMAQLTGRNSSVTANEIMRSGGDANGEIYGCLTGELFNRFWDDGVGGYLRGENG